MEKALSHVNDTESEKERSHSTDNCACYNGKNTNFHCLKIQISLPGKLYLWLVKSFPGVLQEVFT